MPQLAVEGLTIERLASRALNTLGDLDVGTYAALAGGDVLTWDAGHARWVNSAAGAPGAHGLVSASHTVADLTTGHVLTALSATTFGFAAPPAGSPHAMLSSTHSDATVGSVARGDLITGQGASATWARLAKGTNGYFLKSDGTDTLWAAHGLTFADIGSGTVAATTALFVLPGSDTPGAGGVTLQDSASALRQWQFRLSGATTNDLCLDREYAQVWYNVLSVGRATGIATFAAAVIAPAATIGASGSAANSYLILDSAAGYYRGIRMLTGGRIRWIQLANATAEAGANTGSNYRLQAYDDAGSLIDAVLGITRAAEGEIAWSTARPFTTGRASHSQSMTDGATAAFTSPHLALLATANIDTTGFVGMTFATAVTANYGYSWGALRSTGGGGDMVLCRHANSATGVEVLRVSAAGVLTIAAGLSATTGHFDGLLTADLGLTVTTGQTLTLTGATVTGLTQASIGGLTTADGPTFDHLHVTNAIGCGALTATTGAFSSTTDASACNVASLKTAGGLGVALDVFIGSLGRFDSTTAPAADAFLMYDATVSKWRPRTLYVAQSGVVVSDASTWAGTSVQYVNTAPSLSDSPGSTPAAPLVSASYKAMIIDLGAAVLPQSAGVLTGVYDVQFSTDGTNPAASGAYVTSTGSTFVHSSLTTGTTYYYRFRVRAGSSSSYGAWSVGLQPGVRPEVTAFGLLIASQLSVQNLAAISADIGTVTAGNLQNASNTAGVSLTGNWTGTWTTYLNLAATGTNAVLHHGSQTLGGIDLLADGTAQFYGSIDTYKMWTTGSLNAFQTFRISGFTHAMTSIAPTDVVGFETTGGGAPGGGFAVSGLGMGSSGGGNWAGLYLVGYQVAGISASADPGAVSINAAQRSGAGPTVTALAANQHIVSFSNNGTVVGFLNGDGSLALSAGLTATTGAFDNGATILALVAKSTGGAQARFQNSTHYLDLTVSAADNLNLGGTVANIQMGLTATAAVQMGALTATTGAFDNGATILALVAKSTGGAQARFQNSTHYLDLTVSAADDLNLGGTVANIQMGLTATAAVQMGALTATYANLGSTATVSSVGQVRLANADYIGWRNAAGSADVTLRVNSSNVLITSGAFTITGALVATSATLTSGLYVTRTTEQVRVRYDATHYLSVTVAATGSTTLSLTGTTPTFTFSQDVAVPGLTATTGHFDGLLTADLGLTVTTGQTLTLTGATVTGLTQASIGGLTTADGPTFDHLHVTNAIGCGALTATGMVGAANVTEASTVAQFYTGQAYTINMNHTLWAGLLVNTALTFGQASYFLDEMVGVYVAGLTATNYSTNEVTKLYGIHIGALSSNASARADIAAIHIDANAVNGTGNVYGLWIGNQAGTGANYYSIYTGTGSVRFGADLTVVAGFGCNLQAPQTAYASGGAAPAGGTGATAGAYDTAEHRNTLITLVNNIRSALVANGIMS